MSLFETFIDTFGDTGSNSFILLYIIFGLVQLLRIKVNKEIISCVNGLFFIFFISCIINLFNSKNALFVSSSLLSFLSLFLTNSYSSFILLKISLNFSSVSSFNSYVEKLSSNKITIE